MPRRRRNFNKSFEIHVDKSCLSDTEDMDEQHQTQQQHMDDLVDIVDGELREQTGWLQEDGEGFQTAAKGPSNYERPSVASGTSDQDEFSVIHDESIMDSEHSFADKLASPQNQSMMGHSVDEEQQEEDSHLSTGHTLPPAEDDADRSLHIEDEADIHDFADDASLTSSHRLSNVSFRSPRSLSRRASKRTEALIQAAAKDVLAQIEHNRQGQSDDTDQIEDGHNVSHLSGDRLEVHEEEEILHDESSTSMHDGQEIQDETKVVKSIETDDASFAEESSFTASSHRQSDTHTSISSGADRLSTATVEVHSEHASGGEGDSSSHHDGDDQDEDDVFSEHSPRSSVGSLSDEQQHKDHADTFFQKTRAPRVSDISQYDCHEEFVPTVRTTPRPAFRSPSSVKAIQMSSPPASVLGSPRSRSSRRTPMQGTSSRIGSPSLQYSPKKTPPRFRKTTPPLVLLHVTIVQLSWPWGETLDNASTADLSPDARSLKESWRLLQDRAGATVLERGILLAHPQGDYEVLEERILDGLELPMRRRARILECGHYLGPSNEDTLISETEPESDDDDYYEKLASPRSSVARSSMARSRQQSTGFTYCTTCKSEIKYDALGKERIFRVKVYASNGLMRSGAWEACWKEMERVDVEVEPVLSAEVQEELQRLAEAQAKPAATPEPTRSEHGEQAREMTDIDEMGDETFLEQVRAEEEEEAHRKMMASSPPPLIRVDTSPIYDDPRRMDEERLREIYGDSAPAASPPSREYSPQLGDRGSEIPSSPPNRYLEVHPQRYSRSPESRVRGSSRASTRPPSEARGSFNERSASPRPENAPTQAAQEDSLWNLLFNAGRIYLQDTKNLVIAVLSLAVLVFAMRGGAKDDGFQSLVRKGDELSSGRIYDSTFKTAETVDTVEQLTEVPQGYDTEDNDRSSGDKSVDPCASSIVGDAQRATEAAFETVSEVIRVVETVTETAYATEVVKVTSTATVSAEAIQDYGGGEEEDVSVESQEADIEVAHDAVGNDDEFSAE